MVDGTRIILKYSDIKPQILNLKNFTEEDLIKKESFLTNCGYKRYFKTGTRELEFILAEAHLCDRIGHSSKFSDFEKYELLRLQIN